MRNVDSHLDKPILLESNKYGQKDHWNVISSMYSYLTNQCIVNTCVIVGSLVP